MTRPTLVVLLVLFAPAAIAAPSDRDLEGKRLDTVARPLVDHGYLAHAR